MTIEFNPAKKTDDKGVGKIHLGEESGTSSTPANNNNPAATADADAAKKKKLLIGGGVAAGVVALATVFALSSGHHSKPSTPAPVNNPPPVTQTYTPPAPPVTQVQQTIPNNPPPAAYTQGALISQSIQAKQGVIYRDDAQAYKDQTGARGEMYIGANGQEVSAGQDFAVHVSLFNKGGVSILVAQGPYAGSRVDFFPTGSQRVTYTKLGQEVTKDGTTVFQALPSYQRTTATEAMKFPRAQGNSVSVYQGGSGLQKQMLSNGRYVTAFTVTGEPQNDGIVSVKIWNGDSYSVNLKTGDYNVSSAFLSDPDYQATYRRTGVAVKRTTVNGALQIAPSNTPRSNNGYRP